MCQLLTDGITFWLATPKFCTYCGRTLTTLDSNRNPIYNTSRVSTSVLICSVKNAAHFKVPTKSRKPYLDSNETNEGGPANEHTPTMLFTTRQR